ncbi:MAG: nucleotidyltransferase domain-containing protein [Patescibacteria group bacterium]
MNQITQEKIQEVTEKIVREFQPEKIILFGSYAWGTPTQDSDVDLFIVKETLNTRETAREIDGSIRPRPFPIDLIVYKPESVKNALAANDFFIKDIIAKGRVLYAK